VGNFFQASEMQEVGSFQTKMKGLQHTLFVRRFSKCKFLYLQKEII